MSADSESIALLERALAHAQAAVERVGPEQRSAATPCHSWDVRALVNHLIDDTRAFLEMVSGSPYQRLELDLAPEEWADRLRAGGASLVKAWRDAGPLGEPERSRLNQNITEFALHGWDVAVAIGQPAAIDPDVAERALTWGRGALKPEYRGDEASGMAFGLEVTVPADASETDRLVAFFGRQPV